MHPTPRQLARYTISPRMFKHWKTSLSGVWFQEKSHPGALLRALRGLTCGCNFRPNPNQLLGVFQMERRHILGGEGGGPKRPGLPKITQAGNKPCKKGKNVYIYIYGIHQRQPPTTCEKPAKFHFPLIGGLDWWLGGQGLFRFLLQEAEFKSPNHQSHHQFRGT